MRIVPLTGAKLAKALELTLRVFPESRPGDFDYPGRWLPYSVKRRKESPGIPVGYWIACDGGKVVGISGLYEIPPDAKEAAWLAWTCVDPAYRRHGLGTRLLNGMVARARRAGKKFVRLYTTSKKAQAAARALYAGCGFVETRRKRDPRHGGYVVYMECRLG